jgi:hypothetical protein
MGVLADLHGDGDPEDERVSCCEMAWSRQCFDVLSLIWPFSSMDSQAKEEFREIKEGVLAEVRFFSFFDLPTKLTPLRSQREFGDRTYKAMWRRYKYRVIIAMSAQFCAQLVRQSASGCSTGHRSPNRRRRSVCKLTNVIASLLRSRRTVSMSSRTTLR